MSSDVDKIRQKARSLKEWLKLYPNRADLVYEDSFIPLQDVLPLAEKLDYVNNAYGKLAKQHVELKQKLDKSKTRFIELTKDYGKLLGKLDKVPSILSSIKYEKFMMASKWNSLKQIADIQELCVRKDGKISVDIVDIQAIIGEALDDYADLVKELLGET